MKEQETKKVNSRVLKFRAWTGSKMEHNIMAGFLGAFYVAGMNEKDSARMSEVNTIYSKETPVMQYTGLKDKNGKEIYEGDLIKCSYCDEDFGEVVYQTEMHRFRLQWRDRCCGNARLTDIDGWATVAGNIYKNPELIKP